VSIGRLLLVVVVGAVAAFLAFKLAVGLLGWLLGGILSFVLPVAVVGGLIFVVFKLTEKKVLGGKDRGILP